MELKRAFGIALRDTRKARHLKQEDFGGVSSQTYLSQLEAGAKGPTLEKTHDLASVMDVHPLTILARCYLLMDDTLTLDQPVSYTHLTLPTTPYV